MHRDLEIIPPFPIQDLSNQLCIIYDLIGQLNSQVEILMSQSQKEVAERSRHAAQENAEACSGDSPDRTEYLHRRREFVQKFVPNSNINLKILTKTYQVVFLAAEFYYALKQKKN